MLPIRNLSASPCAASGSTLFRAVRNRRMTRRRASRQFLRYGGAVPDGALRMLSLSDAQLDCVFAAAQPLDVNDRDLFLRDVARALDGQEIGDGLVARTCREIQRRYFRPP